MVVAKFALYDLASKEVFINSQAEKLLLQFVQIEEDELFVGLRVLGEPEIFKIRLEVLPFH